MSIRKQWYITLMHTDSAKSVSMSVSKKISNVVVCVFLLLILAFFVCAFNIWKVNSDLLKVSKLDRENEFLREDLSNFSLRLDEQLVRIRVMAEWEDNMRMESQLTPINPNVRALGYGGEPFVDPRFLPFCDELHMVFNDNLRRLNFLNAKATLTFATHFDLFSALQTRDFMYSATPSIWPTFGQITSHFGYRQHPIIRHRIFHTGIDIANDRGTLIYATADGTVSFAGNSGGMGNLINVDHASGYQTRYAHLETILVNIGDVVRKGQIIATMGRSGLATGYHLHYEIVSMSNRRTINPTRFLEKSKVEISTFQNILD